MAADLVALLMAAGLSASEAKVYLAGLEMGSATLLDIAKRSGISKTSAFESMESLKKQKLVRIVRRKNRVVYHVVPVESVVETLRIRAAEQLARIDDVARMIPLFSALSSEGGPSIVIHEGADAVPGYFSHLEKIHPATLDEIVNAEDLYSWTNEVEIRNAHKAYKWLPKHSRTIHAGKPRRFHPKFSHRALNETWGTFRGNLAIYGDFVSILTYTNHAIVTIIESKALADSLRFLFNVAWRASDDPK